MTALNRNPEKTNLLQPTKYVLTFSKLGAAQYFCQQVNLPGVTLGEVVIPTPFLDMYSPGTKLTYNPLDVTFLVDEELEGWKQMYNWFTEIADPDGFEPGKESHLSDAMLTVLNAHNNPVLRINFKNCFPLTMSDLAFDTTSSAEQHISCSTTFRYESYKYLTL